MPALCPNLPSLPEAHFIPCSVTTIVPFFPKKRISYLNLPTNDLLHQDYFLQPATDDPEQRPYVANNQEYRKYFCHGRAFESIQFSMMKKFYLLLLLFCVVNIAYGQATYFVDASRPDNSGAGTSWATAKKDLQNALAVAASGDQVWVKAGTYLPTQDPFGNSSPANVRDKTFTLKSGVKVYGGFAGTETQLTQRNIRVNVTTLSGDLGVANTVTDNAYHVVLSVNCSNTTRLDGFTITKGYAVAIGGSSITVSTRVIDRYKGGGISNHYSATTFSNCLVTANSADCSDGNDDSWGAGMDCFFSTSLVENCSFAANSFLTGGGSFSVFGSGMNINGGGITINKCYFYNNTSGSGFIDGSRGGAINMEGTVAITNSVFYNNSAMNGAALVMGGAGSNTSAITNCSFVNNTSSYAGTAYLGFSKSVFRNCIFWNNTPTVTSVPGRNEIYSQETNVANQPTFNNCIIRDATGSPLSITNAFVSASLTGNPLFLSQADGDGADNVWGTADDGLRLLCGSPAVNAGTGATPATDILDLARIANLDIGAYEGNHVNTAFNAIPSAFSSVTISQATSGVSNYSNCTSQLMTIQSGGSYTLSGQTTATVWIEGTQPSSPGRIFVRRHYEITPAINAGSATARVTLYFTQQEFNDFNAVSAVDLPTGPSDAAGKANLLIEKKSGVSNDGSGLPASYTGAVSTLNPADADIVWNSTASRWEVSFDVSGFSGFFIKTSTSTLPLHLISFTALASQPCIQLDWKTENEFNVLEIQVERSINNSFTTIQTLAAKNGLVNNYQWKDCQPAGEVTLYRLKFVDMDGSFRYSQVIPVRTSKTTPVISPTPARNFITVSINDSRLLNTQAQLRNTAGQLLKTVPITGHQTTIHVEQLKKGLYIISFANGSSEKIIID